MRIRLYLVTFKVNGDNYHIESLIGRYDAQQAHRVEARLEELQAADLIDEYTLLPLPGIERRDYRQTLTALEAIRR